MDYNYSQEINNFIKEVLSIKEKYENSSIMDDNFIILLKCIDYFNQNKKDNVQKNIVPIHFGDGYDQMLNDEDNDYIRSSESENESTSSFDSTVTIKNSDLQDNQNQQTNDLNSDSDTNYSSDFFSSEDENDKDIEEEDTEKINKMLAVSKILLNKAVRSKMLLTETVNE